MKSIKPDTRSMLREQQDKAFFDERKRVEATNLEKTARLKALRLALEHEEGRPSDTKARVSQKRKTNSRAQT